MITLEEIMSISKEDLQEAANRLNGEDISLLVEWLSLKDDNIRYQAFLLVKNRSRLFDDVYPYWDTFKAKLESDNSYQRSIGLMLITENVRWDKENKIWDTIEAYLRLLNDEKPITIRQCIQSLGIIATYKPELGGLIASRLVSFPLADVKETMRKSILLDILNVLAVTGKENNTAETESYIKNALSCGILDKKSAGQMKTLFGL